ncbi:MFS transporter [Novosphingobium terrae]|uniref:MFS transporter n=1 Tax=Novosphingobium terrae TaxID=2726189 RepID=UPI00197FBA1E|nr:MFS transporter [Novosphingobium terrae]
MSSDVTTVSSRQSPWHVVFGAGVTQAVSAQPLVLSTFSLFVLPLTQATGWSRTSVLGGYTACALGVAVGLPICGRLIDRFAMRPILVSCWLAYCLCLAAVSVAPLSLPLFYVPFALMGLATSGILISCAKAVVTWFDANRGAGIGATAALMGLGTTTIPIVATYLIRTAGFRQAYLWLACLALVVGLTMILLFVRPRAAGGDVIADPARDRAPALNMPGLSVGEAVRTRHFWLIIIPLCLAALTVTGLQTNIVPLMLARGISADKATVVLSAFGLASLVGRLGGVLLDRFHGTRVGAGVLLLAASGVVLMLVNHAFAVTLFAAGLCGIAFGIEVDLLAFLTSRYFGMRRFGSLIGVLQGAVMVCIAVGPILVGFAYEKLGSYEAVLPLLSGSFIVCAAGILLLGPYSYPAVKAPAPDAPEPDGLLAQG